MLHVIFYYCVYVTALYIKRQTIRLRYKTQHAVNSFKKVVSNFHFKEMKRISQKQKEICLS